jgi:hypothetical protein
VSSSTEQIASTPSPVRVSLSFFSYGQSKTDGTCVLFTGEPAVNLFAMAYAVWDAFVDAFVRTEQVSSWAIGL